jgi:6-phosphofructokinase 1
VEATSAHNGIGVVKLMGREAGFIAAHAAMASGDVDLCLIPEVPVVLEGPMGFLDHLARTLMTKGSAVVVVGEGAGVDILPSTASTPFAVSFEPRR